MKISYGANFKVVGKTDPQNLSHKGAFKPTQGTLTDLADHIGKGHPWMPAILDKNSRRWQQHANYADVLAADIDSGMTIAQALQQPFIAAHCGLAIESSSSTPDHEKFRLVFRLPAPVKDWETIRICNRYLIELLGVADPSCKDASRFFFGALGRSPFLLQENTTLPADFVEQAIAWHQEQERIAEEAYQAALARRQQYQQSQDDDLYKRVEEALSFIPPRSPGSGNYEESIRVLMALTHEFGEADAIALGERWSPSIKGTTWDVAKKVHSFRRGSSRPVTIATVFKLALQYGYRPPKREPDPFGWLRRIFNPKPPKPSKTQAQSTIQAIDKAHSYVEGNRLEMWQSAIAEGYRYILDTSSTGTGKSHEAGTATPNLFEAKQLIYLSTQHRNPTTPTLAQWDDLEARHSGLVRETTPNGNHRWRRARKGEIPSIAANCNRVRLIEALRGKAIAGADTASLICSTCPLREACAHAEGPGYGFLIQRQDTLKSSRLRAHPASLPTPINPEKATGKDSRDYDYSNTVLIWDEAGEIFQVKRSLTVTMRDIEQTIVALIPHPEVFRAVQPLLNTLLSYLDGSTPTPMYGLNHLKVLEQLPVPTISPEEVDTALSPNLGFLNTTAGYGVDLADLPPSLRKKFAEKDTEAADQAEEKVAKQWLAELVEVLSGAEKGHLHLSGKGLTISLPDDRQRKIVQAAKAAIFLDATLNPEDLAMKLGCSTEDIFACRQQVADHNNLKITQVNNLGRLSRQRGNDQQRRASAIVTHYQQEGETKVIDFKDFLEEGWGAWWRDSRGVNDFEESSRLVLVGTPCRNLAELLAEYAILSGCHSEEDDGFKAFVDRAIRADMHQAIGRLRAHRRPGDQLEAIILSDFDLQLPQIHHVDAADITLEAASKAERLLIAARRAIAQLQGEGRKITQAAVAALCDCSQQRISQLWHLLKVLLEFPNSRSSKDEPPELDDLSAIAETAIARSETQIQVLEQVTNLFLKVLKPKQQKAFWQDLKIETQVRILEALLLTLPEEQIHTLCSDC